jgi:uncharacterized protein (DUF58 family)
MKHLFLTNRFFYGIAVFVALMMLAYPFPFLLPIAQAGLILYAVVVVIDGALLFNRRVQVSIKREGPPVLSLGDENRMTISLLNTYGMPLHADVIDELPEQLQIRDFMRQTTLKPEALVELTYAVRPLSRGEYIFGATHVFVSTYLGLIRRRISAGQSQPLPVYPSIVQMKRYEIRTFARTSNEYGIKKVRRIGQSYEFEHIKQYVRGDDYRRINWRATGRRANLMVNEYEDEKSQQVYCLIDKSRVMHMPFHGLSLFDYSVNTSLVISNIVLGKQDKAGLITFAETPKTIVKAERSKTQLKKIMEALYKEKEGMVEANYESLYMAVQKSVTGRALLLLFTNFESSYSLERVLPQLKKLNDRHLLVVVFFENSEITTDTSSRIETLADVYTQITAEHYAMTKIQLMQELKQHGIMSMLTKPELLTVSTLNKYLEIKARGII